MPGINLAHSSRKKEEEKKEKRQSSGSGTVLMVLAILLVLGAWGGLYWYDLSLASDIAATEARMEEERESLGGEEVDGIADTAFRLEITKESLDRTETSLLAFPFLESAVIPEVVLTECSYDSRTGDVTVIGKAVDFPSCVRQLVELKRSDSVRSLSVSSLERHEEGGVIFSASFSLAE